MQSVIAGNWKMNKDRAGTEALVKDILNGVDAVPGNVELMIAPAFPFLDMAARLCEGTRVKVAAQNCHAADHGAYTGEVSASMLKSLGVHACIVGHSERRQYYGETDAQVKEKVMALHEAGLTPIYCCGETLEQRDEERHFAVITGQLEEALHALDAAVIASTIVAYEPVWAIGTGRTATDAQAQEVHAHIRKVLHGWIGDKASQVPLLYGGSCKPDNAAGLFAGADVNGGLIGGASLTAGSFLELARIAASIGST